VAIQKSAETTSIVKDHALSLRSPLQLASPFQALT
jgi:hypothetical protein